jgi:DNA-binding response OmpR family regulator
VEDDEEICEILQYYILKNDEYNLTIIHSAEKALSLVEIRTFDLVLLDIMLPGIDGIEFCRKLRENSFCSVIFISCLNDDETIIKALNMGGDDYLVKPFQAPVLLARIEANLRRAQYTVVSTVQQPNSPLRIDAEKQILYKFGERFHFPHGI